MAGLDLTQFKELVVVPALIAAEGHAPGFSSAAGINLTTGTFLKESLLTYVHQIGVGPALGLGQMEPATHNDLWTSYLDDPVGATLRAYVNTIIVPGVPLLDQLVFNLRYAVVMARTLYYRERPLLPSANDAAGLCAYYKKFYNTAGGAAVVNAAAIAIFQQAIDA